MLIQEIIRQQTIGILDKILSNNNDEMEKNQHKLQNRERFTIQEYVKKQQQKSKIQNDEKQILRLLLTKHLESKNENGKSQQTNKFSLLQLMNIMQQIKQTILDKKENSSQLPHDLNKNQNQNSLKQKQRQSAQHKLQNLQITNDFTSEMISSKQQSITLPKTQHKQQLQISQLSKKLKKQNQFIMRNIDRIKKYATQSNEPLIEYERTQLQQIKISHQISHKLFHLYKGVFPSNVTTKEIANFQTKQQYKSTLNYHKILEIFNDAMIKLQIQNKLSLLRMIKKFSFNQNFIQLQEWVKIYRAVINNLDVKEVVLQRLVKVKEEERKSSKFIPPKQMPNIQIKIPKSEAQYRTRRIKTQASVQQTRFVSLGNIIKEKQNPHSPIKNNDYLTNQSGIRPIGQLQKTQSYKTYNPNQYRQKHKKLLNNLNEVMIKNLKKDLRSQKMIGLTVIKQKAQNNQNNFEDDQYIEDKNEFSYLRKAIKAKKISKITWQSLFDMKQDTMHHNISIPAFLKNYQND